MPVASTAGPETRTRIWAASGRARSMTSSTSTSKLEIAVPRTTVSAVQRAPGWTSPSAMIGSPATRGRRRHERSRESGE